MITLETNSPFGVLTFSRAGKYMLVTSEFRQILLTSQDITLPRAAQELAGNMACSMTVEQCAAVIELFKTLD